MTTVPSLLFEVNGSVTASSNPAKRASFWCVSRLICPFSRAQTSSVSSAVPDRSVIAPSGPREMFETVRRPVVSFSTGPPPDPVVAEAGTLPTHDSRSSSNWNRRLAPSAVQNRGPETGRSRAAVRILGAPPAAGTTASLLWL